MTSSFIAKVLKFSSKTLKPKNLESGLDKLSV